MNSLRNRIGIGTLVIAVAAAGAPALAGSCQAKAQDTMNVKRSADIVNTAIAAGSFNTLVAAVQAAGLEGALRSEGPLTVFAPTDEAFAKLPAGTVEALLEPKNKELLTSILTYHVAPGRLPAGEVVKLDRVKTLNGQRPAIVAKNGSVMIGNATVTATDIETSNGVIHVIDSVMMPTDKNIVTTAVEAGSFNTLAAALEAAGLVEALQGEGPFTVFAPTDEAFAKLPAGTVEDLLRPENKDRLTAVLTYHVVSGNIYGADVRPGRVETLQGSELKVSRKGNGLRVDQANIVTTDIVTSNGVIHVIDQVILPDTRRADAGETEGSARAVAGN